VVRIFIRFGRIFVWKFLSIFSAGNLNFAKGPAFLSLSFGNIKGTLRAGSHFMVRILRGMENGKREGRYIQRIEKSYLFE
jgi:hypothetical protein